MRPIDLLACDVDRTLLTHDYRLPDAVVAALARLGGAGVRIVLATARSPAALMPYAERLGLLDLAICFNGGWIGSLRRGRALVEEPIARRMAIEVMERACAAGVLALWYRPEGVAVVGDSPLARREMRITGERLAIAASGADLPGEPAKIMCVRAEGDGDGGFAAVRAAFADRLSVAGSHWRLLEIGPRHVSKRTALAWVARHLGIERSRTAAAGDAENDLDMLRWAGVRITVGNAVAAVRDLADFVGPSCDDAGMAVAADWLRRGAPDEPARKTEQD